MSTRMLGFFVSRTLTSTMILHKQGLFFNRYLLRVCLLIHSDLYGKKLQDLIKNLNVAHSIRQPRRPVSCLRVTTAPSFYLCVRGQVSFLIGCDDLESPQNKDIGLLQGHTPLYIFITFTPRRLTSLLAAGKISDLLTYSPYL